MSWFTWAWIAFGLYFAVVEGVALARSKRGDTLSEQLWWLFGTAKGTKPTAGAWVRRGVLVLALGWLATHLLFGGQIV